MPRPPPSPMLAYAGSALAVAGGLTFTVAPLVEAQVEVPPAVPVPETAASHPISAVGLMIAFIGLCTAGLPHAYNSLRLILDARRDRLMLVMADREKQRDTEAVARELARVGNLVNQVGVQLHAFRETAERHKDEDPETRFAILGEALGAIDATRDEVVGRIAEIKVMLDDLERRSVAEALKARSAEPTHPHDPAGGMPRPPLPEPPR